jgi:phage gpG-like protein
MAVKFQVDSDKAFQKAIQDALREVSDLTIPYTLIAKSWFQGNKAIFSLKGPGKYVDLKENYKKQKQKAVGFIYPILKRSGALEQSITNPTDSNSINLIINKNTLILGTKIPYGAPHQFGAPRINLPARPFILIGAEQTAPDQLNRRRDAWIAIIEDYVTQVSRKFSDPK